jgi:DNA topoisomerase IA
VEREREIQAFQSEEYWSIEATLSKHTGGQTFGDQALLLPDTSP